MWYWALAIAARKLGASAVVAFDLDEWSYENTLANCERNELSDVRAARHHLLA